MTGTSLTGTFFYRLDPPGRELRQGEHASSTVGDAGLLRGSRLLRDVGEARRLSVADMARDPFRRLWVREYLQHSILRLWVLVDASASMRVGSLGYPSACRTAAALLRSAAFSSHRVGDAFGVVTAAERVDETLSMVSGRDLARALHLADRVAALDSGASEASGLASNEGLRASLPRIGQARSLVLVVSDFLGPLEHWSALFGSLRSHSVCPVVVWSHRQLTEGRLRGLVTLSDPETGGRRTVWMRASSRRSALRSADTWFGNVQTLFRRHRLRPVHFHAGFDALALTQRFLGANVGANVGANGIDVLTPSQRAAK